MGDQASVRMPCARPYSRTSSLRTYGCASIWLTAGTDVGLGGEPLEVGHLEVRDADGLGPAVLDELDERLPGRHVVAVVQRRQRPVDEEQVDRVGPQLGEGLVERSARVVRAVEAVVELGGQEHLVAPEALDGRTDLRLVLVHLRRVDVAVADLERRRHRLDGVGGLDLVGAEAELGDRRPGVHGQVRDSRHEERSFRWGRAGPYPDLPRRSAPPVDRDGSRAPDPVPWPGSSGSETVQPTDGSAPAAGVRAGVRACAGPATGG
jgi:hypothetical protein